MTCPLCSHEDNAIVHTRIDPQHGRRDYHRCSRCCLIFLPPEQLLSPENERRRYDLHQNHPEDQGYVRFLNQLVEPLVAMLPAGAAGLDYGCGPGPTVSVLLRLRGFDTAVFDPVYFPNTILLEQSYDFVTCTETVEHFYHPRREWQRFKQLVKPGGLLGIMTGMYRDIEAFKDWWYPSEPTHVNFYHSDTWTWISAEWGWEYQLLTDRVIVLRNGRAVHSKEA